MTRPGAVPSLSKPRHVFVEVTNTLAVDYITGFQRLTRELLTRLPGRDDAAAVRFVPVVWCGVCDAFRHLSESEARRLASFSPPPPAPTPLARLEKALPRPLARAMGAVLRTRAGKSARAALARTWRRRRHPASHDQLRIERWPDDSWFLDLEAAWHDVPHRSVLLPRLRNEGVRPATLVADVIPTQFPQWFDDAQIRLFTTFIEAHLAHSERFVCISRCSERDVNELADRLGLPTPLDTAVITMGANFQPSTEDLPRPPQAPPGRYLLNVGTVEPRKNHDQLIRAFDRLAGTYPDLSVCFVGKAGWLTDDLQGRLRNHPMAGGRFRWLEDVDDLLLDALYRHAFLAVQPAYYEGYGTPVIEALANGVPTLASTRGALPEAGGGFAEYFDPDDLDALVSLIVGHLDDPDHHNAALAALVDYRPPTWEQGAAGLIDAFSN
ncbi:MAG: glycosyltransferase family 4 protein [Microthrixaceae bacterium]|nr:glycosyltransferase family 4 protein [Microthrixaceae bacterium]